MKVPLAGGNPTTLVSGLYKPYYIAVDENNVYWTDNRDGTVITVAK